MEKAKAKDDADVLDSWEEALDEDGNVKESWDQESEDEVEDGVAAKKSIPHPRKSP